ncbi:MAG: DUF3467 domain-containing protein [Desulfobacterales bacterium]|nr:MAG: DUF3467 domain-containing protein [Desulfobacterales bacterium]
MDPCSDSSHKHKILEGRYANHFAVGYGQCEFIFDFGQSYFESDHAELYFRIITSPIYAKAFLKVLQETVEAFETTYGDISD